MSGESCFRGMEGVVIELIWYEKGKENDDVKKQAWRGPWKWGDKNKTKCLIIL